MSDPVFKLPSMLEGTSVDVILKSADGVDFPVHKMFLAAGSTAFESTFLVPQSSQAPEDTALPSVTLVETGDVISLMLTYIYPVERPPPNSLDTIIGALRAAKKYDMLPVISGLRPHLLRPEFLEANPLAVYGIASSCEFINEARIAHRQTLKVELFELLATDSATNMSGDGLAKLLKYRQVIADRMIAHLRNIPESDDEPDAFRVPSCNICCAPYTWVFRWQEWAKQQFARRPSTDGPLSWWIIQRFRSDIRGCVCDPEAKGKGWDWGRVIGLKEDLDAIVEEALEELDWSKSSPF